MPLFNWKSRFQFGRKTPEPERAVHVTLPSEPPSNVPDRRTVRFTEEPPYRQPDWTNEYGGEARVIGSVTPAAPIRNQLDNGRGGWQSPDDVRVTVAPLAPEEEDLQPPPRSAGAAALLNLRQQNYGSSRGGSNTLPSQSHQLQAPSPALQPLPPPQLPHPVTQASRSTLQQMNVVFLQANDEVKRAILPPDVSSLHQVKMAFARAFPNIGRHAIEQPHVKIYIQEPSKGQLFYELDDPRDITNKAVLRLKEHSMASPMRMLDHPDYHSETEADDQQRMRATMIGRPASAMAEFSPQRPVPHHHQLAPPQRYFDSDDSGSEVMTRSGSATPVIDRESRERMENMERQLAGLSSLVHTALVSKGMNARTQRDMDHLRREILALHNDGRESSEEPPSLPDGYMSPVPTHQHQQQLSSIRNRVQQTGAEARQLRRQAQMNAQAARSLIRDAGDQIAHIIAARGKGPHAPRLPATDENDTQLQAHSEKLSQLLASLTDLEQMVEGVRGSVLHNNRKLKMSEVEQLTIQLADLGSNAATLKSDFAPLQAALEERIRNDMQRVVRDEKLIKEQNSAVDQSLRRCKALANIMVTMKKLAMVQDPSIQRREDRRSAPAQSSVEAPPPADPAAERPAPYLPNVKGPSSIPDAPEVPPPPTHYPPASPAASLDGVLQEVGQSGMPPRPPSRFSVQDVRQKFTKPPELPDQLKSLIEDVARRASPAPERDVVSERRQELEERQERLAEKQRQLRNQFQQLQQLNPMQ